MPAYRFLVLRRPSVNGRSETLDANAASKLVRTGVDQVASASRGAHPARPDQAAPPQQLRQAAAARGAERDAHSSVRPASGEVAFEVPGCLRCGRVDRMVGVPAVIRDGRSTTVVRGQVVDPWGPTVPLRANATRVSALAAALARPRRPLPPAVPIAVLVIAGLMEFGAVDVAIADHGRYGTAVLAGFLAVVVALCAVLAGWWRGEAARRGQVASRALYLWRRCWYCGRCDMVSVVTTAGSHLLAARGLAASLTSLAARMRWQERS
jgi:hypothetical protein